MTIKKLSVKEQQKHTVIALIEKYKELGMSGLHIILDDGNYEDKDVEFCTEWCNKQKDYIGTQICYLLKEFTKKERKNIVEEPWEVEK